jgi:UDP-hydrolysing UDP-N-acetyl-D-glucosamine 2-epimerase
MPTKVLAFTGIRSDYDLLSGVFRALHQDPQFEIGLIVSGAHLSPTYGMSVENIETDGIPIIARIESLIDANTSTSRLKSASILLQGCLPSLEAYKPDLILYAGDREDVIVGALTGAYLRIPTVHFFGGDHATDANVDNLVRHAASKLSTFHFVSHPQHAERLQHMGEMPERIRIVGNPALDRFVATPPISKEKNLEILGKPSWKNYALVIYHPILGEQNHAARHFEQVLSAIDAAGIPAFINYPNVDAGSREIIAAMDRWKENDNFVFFRNLPSVQFTNLMRHASLMVGNSSAGLLEAPIIPLAVVNVGSRQRGRLATNNVIFVDQNEAAIRQGISEALSTEFQEQLKNIVSPYGQGDSVEKILSALRNLPAQKLLNKTEDPLA